MSDHQMHTGDLLDGTTRGKNRRWIASIVSEEDIQTAIRRINEGLPKEEKRVSLTKLDFASIVDTYSKLLNDTAADLLSQVIREVA